MHNVCFPESGSNWSMVSHVGSQPPTKDFRSNPTPEGLEPLTKDSRIKPLTNCTIMGPTCPIHVWGDPRGLHHATVVAVDPRNTMPLVLSNGDGIPSTNKVKRIQVLNNNELVDHQGIFRSINRFNLKKRGSTTIGDAIGEEGAVFTGIDKKHIKMGMERCKEDRFALEDIVINKLISGDGACNSAITAVPVDFKKEC
jgi:hypothetical protein